MADAYSYSFSGTIPRYYTTDSARFSESVNISGSFVADYGNLNNNASFLSNRVIVDGRLFSRASFTVINPDASAPTYNVRFSDGTTSTAGESYVDFSYTGQTPTSFSNASYYISYVYNDTLRPSRDYATYQTQQLAVTSGPPCYCTGTLIRTERGDIAVEALRVGDSAITANGACRPIRWIGSSTINPRRHPRPAETQPVRIRAHALAENRPARDLVVSPGHAIALDLIGEVLVPAVALVNGATIVQEDLGRITYWHVELDTHDLLVAEGQAAESYLDMGNRRFFSHQRGRSDDDVVGLAIAPDANAAGRSHADFCRPFHADGWIVAFARERLQARAMALGWHLSNAIPWAGVHILADGTRVEPEVHGETAVFAPPSGARDIRLIAPAAKPSELGLSADARLLGIWLADMRVGAGTDARTIDLADPLLSEGFHAPEDTTEGPRRWTMAEAPLSVALWPGDDRRLTLRLDATMPALPRWSVQTPRRRAAA